MGSNDWCNDRCFLWFYTYFLWLKWGRDELHMCPRISAVRRAFLDLKKVALNARAPLLRHSLLFLPSPLHWCDPEKCCSLRSSHGIFMYYSVDLGQILYLSILSRPIDWFYQFLCYSSSFWVGCTASWPFLIKHPKVHQRGQFPPSRR